MRVTMIQRSSYKNTLQDWSRPAPKYARFLGASSNRSAVCDGRNEIANRPHPEMNLENRYLGITAMFERYVNWTYRLDATS